MEEQIRDESKNKERRAQQKLYIENADVTPIPLH